MMNCPASLALAILLTIQGVCGQGWNVTYQPESVCAFVGASVNMSCSYTYTSYLTIKHTYWSKDSSPNPPDLMVNPDYRDRTTIGCQQGANICHLHIESLTMLDTGTYYCSLTTKTFGKTLIGATGVYLDIKKTPLTSVSISPSGDIQEGREVRLTCSSRSDLPVQSHWYKDDLSTTPVHLGTGHTYTVKHFRPEDSGKYFCYSTFKCGYTYSPPVYLQVVYSPKNTTVSLSYHDGTYKGNSVTLTCSSDANPPVESYMYTWFKVDESTPVGSGQQYSITNISSEDGGQYYCEVRNKYGAENSTAVSITVKGISGSGGQSPVSTAVITVSVCGAVGLLCLVFFMSKKEATRTRQEQNLNLNTTQPDAVYQSLNPNTIQPDAVYQSLNPNTTQPDAVYQSLNPNTIQPDAVYQSLNPNTTQPDAVYQSLNLNTTQPDAIYPGLNPNTTQPDAVYQSLNPNTIQPDAVYQSLNLNTTQPDAIYPGLNPNTTQPDAVYPGLNPNTTQPNAVSQSLNLNTTQLDAVYQSLNPNTTQLDTVYQSLNPNTTPPNALTRAWSPTPPNTRQFTKF
ncbi:B-cell receptor CD22-like isoform X1 [Alosa pseudoharengus]|uniref:B-cell receptor CD22-like isoform X1 n=1 Tax=Alosa pseudoharengus TaxID=34774 RepID=UPI003F8C0A5C